MILRDIIRQGEKACEEAGVDSNFARFLMLELLNEKGIEMYFVMEDALDKAIHEDYLRKLKRVCENEPLGYVLGYHYFYGYQLKVNPSVLIPRQETEELVSYILSYIDEYYVSPKIVDVACGSGAIGLVLSKELSTHVVASDISEDALRVAQENAHSLDADMIFYQGDMLEPIIEQDVNFDILICNPPYIKQHEKIQSSVYDFEPHVALFGGEDGLYFYRKVLEKAHLILNKGGLIAFEIGYDIGEGVKNLAKTHFPNADIRLVKDMNQLDRFVFIHLKETEQIEKDNSNRVIELIQNGKTVAIPTDTVYGLAVRSDNASLYQQLKEIKERPDNKPFPLMVSSLDQLKTLVELDERALKLVNAFMPGPVTFIFKKKEKVFPFLDTQATLGIRMADDPWVIDIIDKVGVPLWLPSANKSSQPTGTTSQEVLDQLDGCIDGVVLGVSDEKESSSVFDISGESIVELRKGPIKFETLQKYLEKA